MNSNTNKVEALISKLVPFLWLDTCQMALSLREKGDGFGGGRPVFVLWTEGGGCCEEGRSN